MNVAIVVISRNQEEYVGDAVRSALRQPAEVVCVDDSSTDGTLGVFRSLNGSNVISLPKSVGPAAARQAGVLKTNTEWIVCLDGDDVLHPRFVDECLWRLTLTKADFAYTDMMFFGKVTQEFRSGPFDYGIKSRNNLPYCAMISRDMWEKLGGHLSDEEMFCDWGFWIRAWESHATGVHVPMPLFGYRRHDGQWTDKQEAIDSPRLRELFKERYGIYD